MKPDGTFVAILLLNAANVAWLIGSGEWWFVFRMILEVFGG